MTEFDHQQAVSEYLELFPHRVIIHKNMIHYGSIREWCKEHMGTEFRDWFWFAGGPSDDHAMLRIKDSKKHTLFMLRWGADV